MKPGRSLGERSRGEGFGIPNDAYLCQPLAIQNRLWWALGSVYSEVWTSVGRPLSYQVWGRVEDQGSRR